MRYIDFCKKALEQTYKSLDFDNRQIEWHNKYIKECRQKDRELVEWVWSKGVVTENQMKWFNKDYKSVDTIYHLRQRNYYYRSRKKNKERIEYYKKQLNKMGGIEPPLNRKER